MATATFPITNPYGICVDCGKPATGTAGTDGYCDACGPKHNARTLQQLPVNAERDSIVDEAAALLAILDALALVPPSARSSSLQMHDTNGALLVAIRMWAGAHGLTVTRIVLDLPDRVWDAFEIHVGKCRVTIHDERSRREPTEPEWRPSDGAAIRSALRKPMVESEVSDV